MDLDVISEYLAELCNERMQAVVGIDEDFINASDIKQSLKVNVGGNRETSTIAGMPSSIFTIMALAELHSGNGIVQCYIFEMNEVDSIAAVMHFYYDNEANSYHANSTLHNSTAIASRMKRAWNRYKKVDKRKGILNI